MSGAFVARRGLDVAAAAFGVALIFIILTPLIWRRLVETIEKVGWTSGIIAALFTLLPVSIQDLPTGWKFAPITIAGIILSLTAYHSRRKKSKKIKVPIKQCWTHFTHARRNPDADMLQTDGIHHYNSRLELPPFDRMLSCATVTVDMAGLDFRIVVHQFMSVIKDLIYLNIRVTFLLLDPNSDHVATQSRIVFAGGDLKESIYKSLELLCREKTKFPPNMKGNLIIRTYDYPPEHSIIIIDEGHDNAWIQVETRPTGSDSSSRPSAAWHKRYDEARYNQNINE
jgi:hypothetical protein